MIAALTGILQHVDDGHLHLSSGPMLYEVMFPAAAQASLQAMIGDEVTLYTIFYLAGDPARGGLEPTLIGFLRPQDKKFFELFTTVKGIGPKRALRALAVTVDEIATAIENKDAKFLIGLPEIGKRTAEQIIAELAGKLRSFADAAPLDSRTGRPVVRRDTAEEDAIAALMALGERRADAQTLLERAKSANPDFKSTDQFLREMLRLRTSSR